MIIKFLKGLGFFLLGAMAVWFALSVMILDFDWVLTPSIKGGQGGEHLIGRLLMIIGGYIAVEIAGFNGAFDSPAETNNYYSNRE